MKNQVKLLFAIAVFYSLGIFAQVVNVTSYGATVNNSSNDDVVGIRAAIDACRNLSNPILYFPAGNYHVTSDAGTGDYFYIDGINNLTIDGAGSTIIYRGIRYGRNTFQFLNCKNLIVKNLNTKFENPPFSQGRIIARTNTSFDLQIQPGFSPVGKVIRNYAEYDGVLGQQMNEANHTWNRNPSFTVLSAQNNTIRINDNEFGLPVGAYVLLRHTQYDGYTYVVSRGCENVVLENLNIYSASGYPFYANEGAKNITFKNCGIRKTTPDFWATSTADGAHMLDARGEIVFDGCHFEGMCDDGVNLHGYFVNVTQQTNIRTINIQAQRSFHSLRGWAVGDVIEFFRKDNRLSLGTRTVTSVTNVNYGNRSMTLGFNADLPTFPGGISAVEISNISCIGNLTVKNSTFKGNRSRGVLVSTNNTIIENSTFNRTLSDAILVEVSQSWDESTPARNLIIRNNIFEEVDYGRTGTANGAISIRAEGNTALGSACDVFRNISITGNTFRKISTPSIVARRVSGLEISGNIVENPGTNGRLIRYGNSKNIVIGTNTGATIENMGSNCPNDAQVSVTGVTVTPETATIAVNQTVQLTSSIIPTNASNSAVTWSSSNPSVATVSATGLVTAVAASANPVTITSTTVDGGFKDTSMVTVSGIVVPEGAVSVTGPAVVSRGEVVNLNVAYNATTTRDIIVELQENGIDLNGDRNRYTKIGQATLTVSAGQNTVSISLTVSTTAALSNTYRYVTYLTTVGGGFGQIIGIDKTMNNITVANSLSATGVTVTPETATISVNQTVQLTSSIIPTNASNSAVTWSSSNPSVATVSATGLVTAVAASANPVTITATTVDGGFKDTSMITVSSIVVPEGAVSVTGPAIVSRGEVVNLNVAYNATTTRDIIVYLQENNVDLNGDNNRYTRISSVSISTVGAGQNNISAQLTVDNAAPLSDTYRYVAYLTTVGGGFAQMIGVDKTMNNITVNNSTLSTSGVEEKMYSVYPNPAEDFIQVSIPDISSSKIEFKIYDMLGHLVLKEEMNSGEGKWNIDLENLNQGVHVLEVRMGDKVGYSKIIKK